MLTIRRMRPDDVPGAISILEQWNMAPTPDRADAERSSIAVENSFVAEDDGEIVGVASFIVHSATMAETASLAVDPRLRGAGVGRRLQEARLAEMRRRGIRTVRTETDRPETIRWYVEQFGYRVVGKNPKKHAFSLSDVHEWTVLELELGARSAE